MINRMLERFKEYIHASSFNAIKLRVASPDKIRSLSYGEVKKIERVDSPHDIAVIQAATDDNPTLSKAVIEEKLSIYEDPDDIAIRRYGIFRQVSGRFRAFR